ncbi:MAG: c-type cytochrome [Nitrospiraceae bacterium]|nr:c-type cytochrome [Nitrospiraceae bacterium]
MKKTPFRTVMPPATHLFLVAVLFTAVFLTGPFTTGASAATGKELFDKNCSECHYGGGNVINPKFTLHKKDREKHGVKTVNDIISRMRQPGPGMVQFTRQMIPDSDAGKIAEYILKTF